MRFIFFLFYTFSFQLLAAQNWDINQLRKINSNSSTSKTNFWDGVEKLNDPITIGTPVVLWLVAVIKKDKKIKHKAISATGSFGISTVTTFGLKKMINRDRPFITYTDIIKRSSGGSPSFPSGHTSSIFATATSLTLSYPKWYVIIPAYIFAGASGYARIYQGVHYPSDVLAGAFVGSASAWISHKLTRKFFK